ncbi:FMRFamide receptor-like [Tubulanus polymorphus]|uniref:FMRFamide receptor-like n=1 Tax=Tubulanus polymorphus TaxID=672921 RepID=UPI003DA233B5
MEPYKVIEHSIDNKTYISKILNQHLGNQNRPPDVATGVNPNDQYESFYQGARYATGLVSYPIVTILGITGNALSLVVLSRKKMATSTNVFLSALSVSDLIKLVTDFMYFLVLAIDQYDTKTGNRALTLLYPFAHYIFNMAVCITAWLTVSVSAERYISVCHPTRAITLCTIQRARIVSASVFILMAVLAIPSGLRYQRVLKISNITNQTCWEVEPTELGRNQLFITAYMWVQNLLRSIIPLFVLAILNSLIIYALFQSRIKGKQQSSRNRITMMLIAVVIIFLICITPDAIMSFFKLGYYDANPLVRGIREFTDLLLAINSAVNFILYYTFSSMFRDTFYELFGCRCAFAKTTTEGSTSPAKLLRPDSHERNGVDSSPARSPAHRQTSLRITNGPQTYL